MSDVQTLLARRRDLGAELTSTPHGTLKVKAPAPLPEALRAELNRRKTEVLALLTQQQASPLPCPACGGRVRLDPPDKSLPTRFWTCPGCGTWGATREGAPFPVVWVSGKTMQ